MDPKGFVPAEKVVAHADKKNITVTPKDGDHLRSAKFDKNGAMMIGNHKTLLLVAGTEAEALEWAKLISFGKV